jgi:predicted nucleic acid-binding protein
MMSENPSDVTGTAVGLIKPISSAMFADLEVDLNEADALRIGEAFAEVFKAGVRVGAGEVIAAATEQASQHGVTLDLHFHLVETADEDEQT